MLAALKYKDVLLDSFYLDPDDITVRRKIDGYKGRYAKHDVVAPFMLKGSNGYDYKGVHVPKTRTSVSFPWLLTVLRGIPFNDGDVIDHINGDITDNRRSNIRIVTQNINSKNRKKHSNNTSGYTGIHYNKQARLYMTRVTIQGERLYRSSKTLSGAIKHLESFKERRLNDGYSERHGK